MPRRRRVDLIRAATAAFKAAGFRAVGVERVLEEAGVSRMTLYNNFGSKDELIVEVLRRYDEQTRSAMRRRVNASGGDVRSKLLAAVAFFIDAADAGDARGCLFLNACAEYADDGCAIRRAAAEHKTLVREYLESLACAGGVADPEGLAERLMLVIDGVLAASAVEGRASAEQPRSEGRPGSAAAAGRIAELVVDAALPIAGRC